VRRGARTGLAFATTFTLFAAGIAAGNKAVLTAYAAGADPYAGLDTLARALTQIQRYHVDERGADELIWAAIDGMAGSLDPHTHFFDPEDYARIRADHDGRYFGVGLQSVAAPDGGIEVVGVVPASPADRGGLAVGDRIISVDGQDITGISFDEATALIKGERGEPVVFGYLARGTDAPHSVELVRDEIVTPAATGGLIRPGLGYARIEQFRDGTTRQLVATLEEQEALGGPLRGLVLDLRGNPGGLLTEAAAMVDLFVGDSLVVTTRDRSADGEEVIRARAEDSDRDIPLVVLVDGDSASGSEIVAGVLQDLDRATIVGSPTWGKGSVQRFYEYADGSALKLTIARYYLPSGRTIEPDEGIVPDVQVDGTTTADPASVMRERLQSLQVDDGERDRLLALLDHLEGAAPRPLRIDWRTPPAERLESDPALAEALRILEDALR